eukprot:sb/3476975/
MRLKKVFKSRSSNKLKHEVKSFQVPDVTEKVVQYDENTDKNEVVGDGPPPGHVVRPSLIPEQDGIDGGITPSHTHHLSLLDEYSNPRLAAPDPHLTVRSDGVAAPDRASPVP